MDYATTTEGAGILTTDNMRRRSRNRGTAITRQYGFFTRISRMGPPDKATAMQTCRSAPQRRRESWREYKKLADSITDNTDGENSWGTSSSYSVIRIRGFKMSTMAGGLCRF